MSRTCEEISSKKLAIGTAQFGTRYGVANRTGQVSKTEAQAILDYAWSCGSDTLDTAVSYGESEQHLGELGVRKWKIISKVPSAPRSCDNHAKWVDEAVCGSLRRLRIEKLQGLLLHDPDQLCTSNGIDIYKALVGVKERGLSDKIGISVYYPDQLDALLQKYDFDIVQVPFNILDRRFASSGWLERLCRMDIEVHVRSIFLQGLLLMEKNKRPVGFRRWRYLWTQWHTWLNEQSITAVQACVGFAASYPSIDRIIVGVDGLNQLEDLYSSLRDRSPSPPYTIQSDDPLLINPSLWSKM